LSLVIRLKAMATRHGLRLNIFHVAGTRMIAQGTDGVSRGFLAKGIMAGETMESFIPIHLTASQRSPTLEGWIHSWTGDSAIMLDEEGWFEAGHDIAGWGRSQAGDDFERPILKEGRTYVWCPQPFAADVVIAELRKARIKRQSSAHVFVCPRLCCGLWLKQLYRAADIVFQLLPNSETWPASMHEPLLIGIVFPFIRTKPWQLRGSPKLLAVGRALRDLPEGKEMDRRDLLREFWKECHGLRNMPQNVVRRMLYLPPLP
jgi:hypothetical protein